MDQKFYKDSEDVYLKDLEICVKEGHLEGQIQTLQSLGVVCQLNKDYEKSEKYLKRGLELSKKN
jgi:hypothetical protein